MRPSHRPVVVAVRNIALVLTLAAACGFADRARAAADAAAEEGLFPFVISYENPKNAANLAGRLDAPAGRHGTVRVQEGRFVTDAGPIRFWGTNLCFEGCFPSHDDAERLAARLARLGINCVRLHHMDNHSLWKQPLVNAEFDPVKIERLDYLIHQLKRHGVYVNINLHVSRWYDSQEPGLPPHSARPDYDKGLDTFDPRMIAMQKRFAKDLLAHVNPYTKTAYVDEPAVAFVEINNENGLLCVWRWGKLDALPEPFATTYRKQWNQWLRARYGTTEKLREAWGRGIVPPGAEMLRACVFAGPAKAGWFLNDGGDADARGTNVNVDGKSKILRIEVRRTGKAPWFPQVLHGGLKIQKGKPYTVSFRARAEQPASLRLSCRMDHEPYEDLGLHLETPLTAEWKTVETMFFATHDEARARLDFSGLKEGVYELADVSLRPGGGRGLPKDSQLEDDSVPTLANRDWSASPQQGNDFCDFLWDLDRAYWTDMRDYLKNTLKVRSPILGTQMTYAPAASQAECDAIDAHYYWCHPMFPKHDWSATDWLIRNEAMVEKENFRRGLIRLAFQRVAGKPFAVSELNQPQPNAYGAEVFTTAAAIGAFQGWDAIYSFAYSHGDRYEPNRIESFFDIKSDPTKLVHMPACTAMFVRGDVAKAKQTVAFPFSAETERAAIRRTRDVTNHIYQTLNRDPREALLHGTALALDKSADDAEPSKPASIAPDATRLVSDTRQLCWEATQPANGYFAVNTARTKLFTGFVGDRALALGEVGLKIGKTRLDWATVSLTAIEGEGFDRPGRFLLAATGAARNRGMQLEQHGQRDITCRNRWGEGPVLCEGISARITLPASADRVTWYPLDESGNRREAQRAVPRGEKAAVEIGPQYRTLWYEIEIR